MPKTQIGLLRLIGKRQNEKRQRLPKMLILLKNKQKLMQKLKRMPVSPKNKRSKLNTMTK
jgi:hypothetical protein